MLQNIHNLRRTIRPAASAIIVFAIVAAVSCRTGFATGLKLIPVTSPFSLDRPISLASEQGDPTGLYVAEPIAARVQRLDLTTGQLTTVLDLPYTITGIETGLNGIEFHGGKLYANISGISTDTQGTIRILEYSRSVTNPTQFNVGSERQILSIPNPALSHNGGWLEFGPHDGLLYIGSGDGGNVPPYETKGIQAQNVNHLWGKILRVDVGGDAFPLDPARNYAIPLGNPFAAGGGAPEVLAYGLRHPFRNGFDRDTGDLYVADVGSALFEEINVIPAGTAGQNFGWRPLEGFEDNPFFPDPPPSNAVAPSHVYEPESGAAVIGGYVYRGDDIPWLNGTYFYADFVNHDIRSFRYQNGSVFEHVDRTAELLTPLGPEYGGMPAFGEDNSGELYLADYFRGQIFKIVARTPRENGDYNNDGFVNAADYTLEIADLTLWKQNYGWETPDAGSAVPEPTGLVLAFAACCLAAAPRRRRF
jgi:hypothetical protein